MVSCWPGDQQADQAAGKGQRHGKQHDEGGQQALELRHHDQIHKGQGQSHPLDHFPDHEVHVLGLAAHGEVAALRHLAAGRKLVQGLLQNAGLHGGVVTVQRVGRDGDVLGLVLAGDGVRRGAGLPGGNVSQGAGAGHRLAIGVQDAGVKGHIHHVFLGQRVQIIGDLHVHGGAVHGHRGLGRGGGGEPLGDLLIHLGHGQAVGAHLVAVHLQDDGGVTGAKAVGGVGKAGGAVHDVHHLFRQGGEGVHIGTIDLDGQTAGQLAGELPGHAGDLHRAGALFHPGNGGLPAPAGSVSI